MRGKGKGKRAEMGGAVAGHDEVTCYPQYPVRVFGGVENVYPDPSTTLPATRRVYPTCDTLDSLQEHILVAKSCSY